MNVKRPELVITLDTAVGSSVFGRLIRLLAFPFKWILTGKAEL